MEQKSLLTQEQGIATLPLFSKVPRKVQEAPFVPVERATQLRIFGQETVNQMREYVRNDKAGR